MGQDKHPSGSRKLLMIFSACVIFILVGIASTQLFVSPEQQLVQGEERSSPPEMVPERVMEREQEITAPMDSEVNRAASGESPPTASPAPETPSPTPAEKPSEDDTLWVAGTVSLPTGSPAVDAEVTLSESFLRAPLGVAGLGKAVYTQKFVRAQDTTDESGYYEIQLPESNFYNIETTHENLVHRPITVDGKRLDQTTTQDGRRVFRRDIELEEGRLIEARVVDEEGNPLSDVHTQLFARSRRTQITKETFTDSDGMFQLSISSGFYGTLLLRKPGYTGLSASLPAPTNDAPPEFVLESEGGIISGVVIDSVTDEPMPDVEMGAYEGKPGNMSNTNPIYYTTTTTAAGEFEFTTLGEGKWDLVAFHPITNDLGIAFTAKASVALGKLEIRDDVVLEFPEPVALDLTIIDAKTEAPIEGAAIVAGKMFKTKREKVVYTNEEGHAIIDYLTFDSPTWMLKHMIQIKHPDYLETNLDGIDTTIKDGRIEETIEMTPKELITISGTVISPDGLPVSNILIESSGPLKESRALSGDTGDFEIPVLAGLEVSLVAKAGNGPETWSKPIQVLQDDIDNVTIQLDPGGDLQITVTDPDGSPLPGARVSMIRRTVHQDGAGSSDASDTQITNEEGRVLFEKLPSSDAQLNPEYKSASVDITARHEDFDTAEDRDYQIIAGEVNDATIQLLEKDRSAEFDGFVYTEDGEPIEGVNVQVQATNDIYQMKTDLLGYFHFEGLRPGEEYVRFDHPDYQTRGERIEFPTFDYEMVLGRRDKAPE